MRILFSSYAFPPSLGGIETVSAILAGEFAKAGHEVRVLTETAGPENQTLLYEVIRQPTARLTWKLLGGSNVVFQNNISLRVLLPALAQGKPVVVLHQTWLRDSHGRIGWNGHLKRALLGRVTNVAISHALAADLRSPCVIVPNPYRPDVFHALPPEARDRELVFTGRLVSDKGVELLLGALAKLREEEITPKLTIIGQGPEEVALRRLVESLKLDAQVTFAGAQTGAALAALLAQHKVLVVPSRWAEPFGVVALEGIACGCVAIGSSAGGLPEAIGPCGMTFPNGDETALAKAIALFLSDDYCRAGMRARAEEHLANFQPEKIAASHLALLEKIAR